VRAEVTAMSDHAKRPGELGRLDETVTVTNQRGEVVLSLVHLYVINKKEAAS
jgi:acyl dehydratase